MTTFEGHIRALIAARREADELALEHVSGHADAQAMLADAVASDGDGPDDEGDEDDGNDNESGGLG